MDLYVFNEMQCGQWQKEANKSTSIPADSVKWGDEEYTLACKTLPSLLPSIC